jgi:type IV pilus assembly protein PilZ
MNDPQEKKIGLWNRLKIAYFKQSSNRRRYLRVPLRLKVTNKATDIFEHFQSTNISVGGMFIRSENPYSLHTFVKLEFHLPGSEKPVAVDGKVVRVTQPDIDPERKHFDPGMGIMFMRIDPQDYNAIEKFVEDSKNT